MPSGRCARGCSWSRTIARLQPHADVRLQARIGIATGLVVVGDLIGEGASREEAVVGETPNLAARLQALAEPGSVAIGQTRRLVGGLFELTTSGPSVSRASPSRCRLGRCLANAGRGPVRGAQTASLTPLVGREEELALLLRRWRQPRTAKARWCCCRASPASASRAWSAPCERLEDEPHLAALRQCSPHHRPAALHPVIEQLERAAGFARDDRPRRGSTSSRRCWRAAPTSSIEACRCSRAARHPHGERYPLLEMTPQRQKQRTLEALVDQLKGLAAGQPVLLLTRTCTGSTRPRRSCWTSTIERIQRLPVLVIITFRPEFSPPWPGQPHVSALALTRLGRRRRRHGRAGDRGQGAAGRGRGADRGQDRRRAAVRRGADQDGARSPACSRTRATATSSPGPLPPLAIPATLHDSLLARLDRLAPVKEIAQIGAAIGREFSHELLAAVADRPEAELQAALDQLVESELVFRRGTPPEATYSFKHALVQDAAYGTLLNQPPPAAARPHRRSPRGALPGDGETQPELLAHHCKQAGLVEKAVAYWYQAGRQAMARSAMVEPQRN